MPALNVDALFSDLYTTASKTQTGAPTPTARNHNVAVAQNGTQFTPERLKSIPLNSTITFYFYPSNYSIIQSSFASPCQPLGSNTTDADLNPTPPTPDASQPPPPTLDQNQTQPQLFAPSIPENPIFSGFHLTPNASIIASTKFSVTISDLRPIWIYAVDGSDASIGDSAAKCRVGMSMVINPTETGVGTLGGYRKAAKRLAMGVSGVPKQVEGGAVMQISVRSRLGWMAKHPLGGNPRNDTTQEQEYMKDFTNGGAIANVGWMVVFGMLGWML